MSLVADREAKPLHDCVFVDFALTRKLDEVLAIEDPLAVRRHLLVPLARIAVLPSPSKRKS